MAIKVIERSIIDYAMIAAGLSRNSEVRSGKVAVIGSGRRLAAARWRARATR